MMRMQPEDKAVELTMKAAWLAATIFCLGVAMVTPSKADVFDKDAYAFMVGQRDAFRAHAGRHVPLVVAFNYNTGYWFCATDATLSGDGDGISYDAKVYAQRCEKPLLEWGE